jgi:hypothetical protein
VKRDPKAARSAKRLQFVEELHEITQVLQTLDAIPVSLKLDRCVVTTIEAVAELRREIARRGWNKKATNRIVFELSVHVAIAVVGIAMFMSCQEPAVRVLGNPNLKFRMHGRRH